MCQSMRAFSLRHGSKSQRLELATQGWIYRVSRAGRRVRDCECGASLARGPGIGEGRRRQRRIGARFLQQILLRRPGAVARGPGDLHARGGVAMPVARLVVSGRQPLALTGRTPLVCGHSGERTHAALEQAIGTCGSDGRIPEASCRPPARHRREHHRVEDRPGAGHAASNSRSGARSKLPTHTPTVTSRV